MTKQQVESLKLGIDADNEKAVLMAEVALEWLTENTIIDTTDIEKLPASAKLFISKYIAVCSRQNGVSSQSIEGLSQSFSTGNLSDIVWDLAIELLGMSKLKGCVRFVAAQKRWQ